MRVAVLVLGVHLHELWDVTAERGDHGMAAPVRHEPVAGTHGREGPIDLGEERLDLDESVVGPVPELSHLVRVVPGLAHVGNAQGRSIITLRCEREVSAVLMDGQARGPTSQPHDCDDRTGSCAARAVPMTDTLRT